MIWKFIEAAGRKSFLLVLLCILGFIVSQIATGVWLRKWSADEPNNNGTMDADLVHLRLGVYGAIGVAQGGFKIQDTFYLKSIAFQDTTILMITVPHYNQDLRLMFYWGILCQRDILREHLKSCLGSYIHICICILLSGDIKMVGQWSRPFANGLW